ncbi:NMDA receptor-regulated protein 1a [Coprinopsis sp. MPI-PUGE-AT-0042]|nr:NMDA receptor-regulated protein 1a [Coprinopsis sp. MPI-PUGE-AT-0042]
MSRAPGIPPKRALPSKEAGVFKEILTLYETRQLKKGQKACDQILKKFPEHGETMCMKGLILTHMGKREEGTDLVKKGVRLDLTSHICWHEALKSYTQALRFDRENLNILRDAAQLQTQLRYYEALVDTRYTLLRLRPNLRQSWVGLSVAHYLNKNLAESKRVLEHYITTLKNVPDKDIDHSETLLYYITLLEDSGEYTEALKVLDTNSKARAILDKTAIHETRARLLTKSKPDSAKDAWISLLDRNSECYDYYRGYFAFLGIALDSPEALPVLHEIAESQPKAVAPKRLALSVATGDDLPRGGLERGVPSIFADLKSLYKDESKKDVIEKVAESTKERLSQKDADPASYLWTLCFLAQHHSFLGRHQQALSVIDQAIEHTPTLPELHLTRGRILKGRRLLRSCNRAQCCRLLDGQDRFINTKCGKEASSIFGLFTKKDAVSPGADLEDMQSLMYLTEEAKAHEQNGKPNLALRKYMAVKKIFEEIEDDQYDFHGYNIRKFTINIYLKMLKWEDGLRSHPAYVQSAIAAARIFTSVHDDPSIVTTLASRRILLYSHLSPMAEKKAKKKAKKAAAANAKPALDRRANEDQGLELSNTQDDDPDGLKLLGTSDPLEQAHKLLHPLITLGADRADVWLAIYDVEIRRKKLLQAASALLNAQKLEPESPELHLRIVDLKIRTESLPQEPPAPIGPAFSEAMLKLEPGKLDLRPSIRSISKKHASSPQAVLACAKALRLLKSPVDEVENALFSLLQEPVALDIQTAKAASQLLSEAKSSRLAEFRAACDEKFELSTTFKEAQELKELRSKVLVDSLLPLSDTTVVTP